MAQNRVQEEYYCTKRTQESCRKQYLSDHRELKYVRVPGDGNCFFRSIAAYYRRTGDRINRASAAFIDPRKYHQLRKYIVEQLRIQIKEEPYLQDILIGLYNDPNNPYRKMRNNKGEISIEKILSTLSKKCKWNLPAFEMMVERVPSILNINLIIYKVEGDSSQYYVTKSIYTPYDGAPVATTISVFLESNHYGLVFPARDPRNAMKESFDQGENDSDDDDDDENDDDDEDDDEDEATAALIAEMLAQNERNAENAEKAKKASRKAKPSVARNLSRKASYNNIAEIERQFAALEMREKPRHNVSRKASRNASNLQFNENMRDAINASMNSPNISEIERQFASLEKKSKNNQIASLREQIRQLESASVKRKPRVVHMDIQNDSFNSNVPINSVEFKSFTVKKLKNELTARRIDFGSKNLKAALYQKYKKATRKESKK